MYVVQGILFTCFFGRLDEDGKVLLPEEILYRVSKLILVYKFPWKFGSKKYRYIHKFHFAKYATTSCSTEQRNIGFDNVHLNGHTSGFHPQTL